MSTKTKQPIGKNIVSSIENDVLYLAIDLKQTQGPSKSGKSELIATTSGIQGVPGTEFKLGLNLMK